MKIIYPGSFDPITNGHLDIIHKIAKITTWNNPVSVLVMNSDIKTHMFMHEQRIAMVKKTLKQHMPLFEVEGYDGNINDYIEMQKQDVIIVRGLRNNTDFDYEMMYETFTRRFDAQTIYITPSPENIFVSSSLVRNLINTGGEYSDLVPWESWL